MKADARLEPIVTCDEQQLGDSALCKPRRARFPLEACAVLPAALSEPLHYSGSPVWKQTAGSGVSCCARVHRDGSGSLEDQAGPIPADIFFGMFPTRWGARDTSDAARSRARDRATIHRPRLAPSLSHEARACPPGPGSRPTVIPVH